MAVDDDIRKILAQAKAKTAPSASYSPLRATEVSQYEKDFRDYLAGQQEARQGVMSERIPRSLADAGAKIKGMAQGAGGSLAGYGSQIPGMFGDAASLYQEFKPKSFKDLPAGIQALPTTEDIQDLLREHLNDSPEFSAGMTGGNAVAIAQGVAALPALAKAAGKGVKALGPTAAKMAEDYLLKTGQMLPVIKPKGGNFLPEGTKAIEGLKLRNRATSTKDPEEYMAEMKAAYTPEALSRMSPETQQEVKVAMQELNRNIALNQFIDKQLTRYVKNEMATPEDPIRALAEKGTLHFDAPQVNPSDLLDMKRQEFAAGNNEKWGYGTSRLAQNWEDAADKIINKIPAGRYQEQGSGKFDINRFDMTKEPGWEFLNKVSPETPLYGINTPSARSNVSIDSVGFPHLIDELRNATNPASGLPRELLLKPESLSRLSVPQAVERVAKINEWRADQIKNARLENMLKADVHKEYPEKGMRWVRLNKPGQFAEESDAMGHSVRGYEPTENGGSNSYGLGGYPAIESGEAKVYSLRDAKGEPHATIEVGMKKEHPRHNQIPDDIAEQLQAEGKRIGNQKADAAGHGEWSGERELEQRIATSELKDNWAYDNPITSNRITQIKGKSNKAPNEEYLPYVQDFVRSGKWSDVGDLRNTGLINTKRGTLDYHLPEMSGNASLLAYGRASAAGEIQPYMTKAELEAVLKKHAPEDIWSRPGQPMTEADITGPWEPEGMKRGGPVSQDAMQMAVWDKAVRKAGGSEVTQAEIDAATLPARMNPNLAAQGVKARENMTPPESVMDPRYPAWKKSQDDAEAFMTAADLVGSAIPLAGPAVQGVKAAGRFAGPELARGLENYMVRTGGILPMDTWHGTPHRFPPTANNPLGEFDPMKIGTGEGAQAYGHGLYLAENPGVAKGYQKDVTRKLFDTNSILGWEEGRVKLNPGDSGMLFQYARGTLPPIEAAKKLKINAGSAGAYSDETIADAITKIREQTKGNLYKVDLPDEHIAKMLDWDKPLSQQSAIADSIKGAGGKVYSAAWYLPTPKGGAYPIKVSLMDGDYPMTGRQLYQRVSQELGGDEAASQYFKDLKIPGIRYLDQGSRAGGGTSNFVVFDPAHMDILERNGVTAASLRGK